MLMEIYCDKFVDEGNIRKPIQLHQGLNTVMGARRAKNSIGKTTFLLIVDFCFGGTDYIRLHPDIDKNVGAHTVFFTYEFNGEKYWFARKTTELNKVYICDENYTMESEMSLEAFHDFLKDKYNLNEIDLSFREIVNGYFRIYGKDNADEQRPLNAFKGDTFEKGIRRLLKMYGLYDKTAEMESALQAAEEKEEAYKAAYKHKIVVSVNTSKEADKNEKKIKELQERKLELASKSSKGLLDIDSVQAEQIAELKRKLTHNRRQRSSLKNQLSALKLEMETEGLKTQSDYSELVEFFPGADIRHLAEIEAFHVQLQKVLRDEYKETCKRIESAMVLLDAQIEVLEQSIISIKEIPNVTTAILEDYSCLDRQIEELTYANENYRCRKELHGITKDLKERYSSLVKDVLEELQTAINMELRRLNTEVCDADTSSPHITFNNTKSYRYVTPNDTGTGSQVRGMMLFDMVSLINTPLPAVIEDSMSLKQIEDVSTIKLFSLFNKTKKQVFVAIDKGESYTDNQVMPSVLTETTVLELSEGHELFGCAWNRVGDVDNEEDE